MRPPVSNISLHPSATVFHYAHCLFEGLKAYRDTNGKVTMFRPDMNMKRMNRTAERVAMPVSPETSKHLLMLDSSIPNVMPSRSMVMLWSSS